MIRYIALASDYDGTLAHHGKVEPETLAAVRRLKASGRKFILVTGRQLEELQQVFPEVEICDLVVAENGALLWEPATRSETLLAPRPPPAFAEALRRRGVKRLAEGRVILATWVPHETAVFAAIRDLRLELQVIFNKGAVMILPSGVNKGSGLRAALDRLGLSPHNVVAVGDAENDHTLLHLSEAGVAVQNSIQSLKDDADLVTARAHGPGVVELIDRILQDDLASLSPRLARHELDLGERTDGSLVRLPPYGASILIAGNSGGGKSTLAASFIERLARSQYQHCIIDPEGDYTEQENAIVLGNAQHAPATEEVMTVLGKPRQNCVVNLIGISLAERPSYFEKLFFNLLQLRGRTGRPHWLILDETHHILPYLRDKALDSQSFRMPGVLMITVEPDHIAQPILSGIDLILAVGDPAPTLASFSQAVGEPAPAVPEGRLGRGEALAWWRNPLSEPFVFRSFAPSLPRRRHTRKYAEGDMGEGSFVFRGPEGKLKLRAQNLIVFLRMAEGVDDDTWNHHFRRGDFESWFREIVKDPELADFTAGLARNGGMPADQSRKAVRDKIQERYTLPT